MCVKCEPSILWFQTQACLKQEPGIASAQPPGGLAPVASVSEREGLEWPFDSAQVWGWRVGERTGLLFRHSVGLGWTESLSGLPGACRP